MPPVMLMVELSAYKPPPLYAGAVHLLIVPPLISMVEEFSAYKPPPLSAVHPLIVPPVMVIFEEFVAYKPPPHLPSHPLIMPPVMLMVELSAYKPTPSFMLTQFRISPLDILNVASLLTITARLHFSITPPYMLKTDFEPVAGSEPIITTQALRANCQFCSVTCSYIFAVAPSNTDTKPPLVFPSIVSVPS